MGSESDQNKKISFSIDVGEGKKLRLIDISTEDDYLIASPLFNSLEDLRLSVTLDRTNAHENLNSLGIETSIAAQNASEILHQSEQKLLSSDSMEPGRPSYLRKSLAWDSAFFTNAGVLDPDELLLINKGFKSRPLRGIQEDVMRRSESGSTMYGDGCKSESFEGDPFEDVRASIQRSGKMFNVASFASASRPAGLKNTQAPKKVDILSRMKGKPVSEGQSITIQSSEKSKNEHTARSGERHRLPLKPPRVSGQVKGISTGQNEGALMGKRHDRVTNEDKFAGTRSVQSLMVNKKFSSSVSSMTNRYSNLSCSSYNSPRRALSPDVSSNHLKRKTKSRKSKLSASLSTSNTSSRYSGKSNRQANLSLSTQSLSMSNHSSGQSPASSADDWSLFPSRKKESIDLKPNLVTTATERRKCLHHESRQASDLQSNLYNQSSLYEEGEISSPLQLNTASVVEICPGPLESVESVKHSGLRMPSPKIGFFDEDKLVERKVREGLQIPLQIRSTSPKKSGASGRKRPAKLTKLGTAETGNVKHVSLDSGVQHPDSRVQPRHTPSHGILKRSSPIGSEFMRNLPDRASNRCIDTPKGMEGENCFKSRKIGAGEHGRRKISQSSSLKGEERRLERISMNKLNKESKGQKAKGNIDHTKANEKRSSSKNGEQVNELSKFLEAIDLNRDMVMELKQRRSHHHSSFTEENILNNRLQDLPNTLPDSTPLPFTEVISSTRTLLGDKTSVCNRSGTYGLSIDTTREMSAEKHQFFSPFEDMDKENS